MFVVCLPRDMHHCMYWDQSNKQKVQGTCFTELTLGAQDEVEEEVIGEQ